MQKKKTSWGNVASWYTSLLEKEGTYQKEVILPNIMRALALTKGTRVLDLGCGSGFFSRAFAETGARVIGVDSARAQIAAAEQKGPKGIEYRVSPAHKLGFVRSGSIDAIALVLAVQNMENVRGIFEECARVLHPRGSLFIVMNHPAFRVPKRSSWEWDEKAKAQFRRVDGYMSEAAEKIQMHPGDRPHEYTVSFHRPLQFYFKELRAQGLCVQGVEEWISHRKSDPGPRARAENEIRKEIPLFLFMRAALHGSRDGILTP